MTDGGVTAVLSLQEAAEQAATSKVDVWRAIQEGALPAQKTSDGGYAIDPNDLFRVFERKEPAPQPIPPEPTPAPDAEDVAKGDEAPETAAATPVVAIEPVVEWKLRSIAPATSLHRSLVEVVRRQYKVFCQDRDRADKEAIRAAQQDAPK